MRPVLVTGATGRVGRGVVDELLSAGVPVRALVREPSASQLPPEVEVVAGDLTIPESLDSALRGIDAAFLVWTAPPDTAPAVIKRLVSNTRRIVLLTSPHKTPHPFFQQPNPMARFYLELERLIETSDVEWTMIRPGMFASNTQAWWGQMIREGSVVRWPYGAAETAPIDERDVSAVAALALRESGHSGKDYILTGPESLSQVEQVKIIGDIIGRPIRFEELSPDQFRAEIAASWPAVVVDMLLSAWAATMGHTALVTSTVLNVTSKAPRTFREWVTNYPDAFA